MFVSMSEEEFLNRCYAKYGDYFDYSKLNFINHNSQITVICPKHGEYNILAKEHLYTKFGCSKCAKELMNYRNATQQQFIDKANSVHNFEYCYDFVDYINSSTKVLIWCDIHGFFSMKPNEHTSKGSKCPKCMGKGKPTIDFIRIATDLYGDYYDYSESLYVNEMTKLKVICPEGHEFYVTPNNHCRGRGCSRCKSSRSERAIYKYLKENFVLFKPQFTFDDCIHKRKLPFDFAILNKDGSVKGLIEYQGEQHFFETKFNNISDEQSLENFEALKIRDKIKSDYCFENGIRLLCIHYTHKENIPIILSQFVRSLDDYLEPL